MAYTGKKPIDHTDVTQSQSMTVTDDLTVDTNTLHVDSTNNRVGIGTASPNTLTTLSANSGNAILELNRANANTTGAVGAVNFTVSDGHSVANMYAQGDGDNEGAHLVFRTTSAAGENDPYGSNTTERMRIDSSGKVGIGDTSPDSTLHVNSGTANTAVTLESTDAAVWLVMKDDTASLFFGNTGGNFALYTNDSERIRVDTSGRLLLGTTSHTGSGASEGQQVIQFAGASQNGLYMDDTRTASGTSNAIIFGRGSTYVGKIETTTAPATNYVSASDERLKENIENADDAGSKIDAIQVRKYDWIESNTHQEYGLIAQELQSIAPLAVSGDSHSDEMMGIDYSKLVPMLIKEIQGLRKRVATLENSKNG